LKNPQIEKFQEGYIITAYRNLTTVRLAHQLARNLLTSIYQAMISDLKADTARWEAERRAWPSGTGPKNSFIVPPKLTTQYRGTLDPLKPVLEAQTITTSLEEI
jgi:hypothetical protein